MKKFRTRFEIIALILEVANGNWINGSRIMLNCHIAYVPMKELLSVLIFNGLLEYRDLDRTYKTTTKGIIYLQLNKQIKDLMHTKFECSVEIINCRTMITQVVKT